MKNRNVMLAIALAVSSAAFANIASAQERTRAEVRQELIQAQNDGSQYINDASYPAVSPYFTQAAAQYKKLHGGDNANAGATVLKTADTGADSNTHKDDCVGPADFCTPYFGN